MASGPFPIIDSHIHLYAASHLSSLNWTADLPSDHVLKQQHSVDEYKNVTNCPDNLIGFVFVETDRKYGLDQSGWNHPLQEIAFLARIARGEPVADEGHGPHDSRFVLGIVPWAPVPSGPKVMEEYVSQVREVCRDQRTYSLIKGFRYLLQDKPEKVMLQPDFISTLRWLGDNEYTFDLGIDVRQGGMHQLLEARELVKTLYAQGQKLKIIINHFCKPNFQSPAEQPAADPEFVQWATCIKDLACYPQTYMKLSGFFSELPSQEERDPSPVSEIVKHVRPWLDVVFSAFGPFRIMFGSDWPVCSVGGPGRGAWQHWVDVVTLILEERQLSHEERLRVWSATAAEAYSIERSNQ